MIYSENITPTGLAARLAEYIADPSTIRARVKDHFGRAPSLDQCRNLRRAVEQRHKKHVVQTEDKFRVFCKRHDGPYQLDADGMDRCTTCKEEKRAKAAKVPVKQVILPRPKAASLFPSWYTPPAKPQLKPATTIEAVCMVFGVTPDELKGGSRYRLITEARSVAAVAMSKRGLAYAQIARLMNLHCHSSARYLILSWDKFCRRNPNLPAMLAQVQRMMNA